MARAKEGTVHEPPHLGNKAVGGGVTVWARMAARDDDSFVFSDDVPADSSRKMYSEDYRSISSAHVHANASELIGRHFILWQDIGASLKNIIVFLSFDFSCLFTT